MNKARFKNDTNLDKKVYLCNEDGEVLQEFNDGAKVRVLNQGDLIIRRSSIQNFHSTDTVKMQFVKVNSLVFGDIVDKYPVFAYLVHYISYGDGLLTYSNGRIVRFDSIPKLCGKSLSTVKRQIYGLIKEDVIRSEEVDGALGFYVNPYVAQRGKRLSKELIARFDGSIYKELIKEQCVM